MKSIHIILISIQHTFFSIYKLWQVSIKILYIYLLLAFINYDKFFYNYYSHLGFNVNILLRIENSNKYHIIQRISILKTNSYIVTKSFIQQLNLYIQDYHFQNTKHSFYQHYSNYLQSLGFINSINYINTLIHKKKYITLDLTFNPLIKRIKIYNHNKLIISSEKLKNLFQKQFGLPKNYHTISYILKQINLWYKIRGFEWITIHLIEDKNIHNINIKINEGKILVTRILCDSTINHLKKTDKYFHQLIKKEFSTIEGKVLNKIILEKIIKLVKKKYSINNIKYIVKHQKNGIILLIKYHINNRYITQSNYQFHNLNDNYTSLLTNKYMNFFRFFNKNSLLYEKLYISFNYTSFFKLIHLFLHNYFIYNFNIINFIYRKNFLLDLYIEYPYLNLYKYILFNLNFHFSYIKKYINPKSAYYYSSLEQYNYNINNFYEKNYLANILYSEIKNKYKICQYIVIEHLLKNLLYQYNKAYIHAYNYKINQVNLLYKSIQTIYSKLIFYNLITKLKMKISNNYIIQQILLKINYYLLLDIKKQAFTKMSIDKPHEYYLNFYLHYFIKIKLIKTYNQYLLIYIKYNIHNEFIKRLFFLQKLLKKSIRYKHQIQKPYFLLNLQYKTYSNKYVTTYIFIHSNINLKKAIYHHKQAIHYNLKSNPIILRKNKYIIYGCGIQIKLPIKQIPYIRLEYITNYKKNFFLLIDKLSI